MNIIAAIVTPRLAVTPQITWVPPAELQVWSTRLAFVIILIWVAYLLMQFALPSKRGGGGLGRGGAVKFVGTAILIIILLDLKIVPAIINNILNLITYVQQLIGIG